MMPTSSVDGRDVNGARAPFTIFTSKPSEAEYLILDP